MSRKQLLLTVGVQNTGVFTAADWSHLSPMAVSEHKHAPYINESGEEDYSEPEVHRSFEECFTSSFSFLFILFLFLLLCFLFLFCLQDLIPGVQTGHELVCAAKAGLELPILLPCSSLPGDGSLCRCSQGRERSQG